jgi:Arc/MetJ-type ribon-helix-helix transcriptional regulator
MKGRISATVDDDTLGFLEELFKRGNYRNQSHLIETLIKTAWAQEKEKSKTQSRLK